MGHGCGRHGPGQAPAPTVRGNQHTQVGYRLRPGPVPGCGYDLIALAKTERGRRDVLQTALAGLLLPSQGQKRGQVSVTDRQLFDPNTFMRRKKAVPVEIEERSRPENIENGQHRTQTSDVNDLFVGHLPRGVAHHPGSPRARRSDEGGVTDPHDPAPRRRTQPRPGRDHNPRTSRRRELDRGARQLHPQLPDAHEQEIVSHGRILSPPPPGRDQISRGQPVPQNSAQPWSIENPPRRMRCDEILPTCMRRDTCHAQAQPPTTPSVTTSLPM